MVMSSDHGNWKALGLRSPHTPCADGGAAKNADKSVRTRSVRTALPAEDPWDVFEIDEETLEPEPEYGDFWGELDDDCQNGGG
jgi:hypothetical protein